MVSWCFEPSQPQRITSGLNTSFTLSPSYSFHKSSHHFFFFFLSPFTLRGQSAREPAPCTATHSTPRPISTGTRTLHSDPLHSSGQPHPTQEKSGEVPEKKPRQTVRVRQKDKGRQKEKKRREKKKNYLPIHSVHNTPAITFKRNLILRSVV